jgi:predicted HicB family RNase H-like nuclease
MPSVKKPITVRIDPTLLEQVRLGAARDNRSVTNFIETALRQRLAESPLGRSRKHGQISHDERK